MCSNLLLADLALALRNVLSKQVQLLLSLQKDCALSVGDAEDFLDALEGRKCTDGEVLCEEGEVGTSFFVVGRGSVKVLQRATGEMLD